VPANWRIGECLATAPDPKGAFEIPDRSLSHHCTKHQLSHQSKLSVHPIAVELILQQAPRCALNVGKNLLLLIKRHVLNLLCVSLPFSVRDIPVLHCLVDKAPNRTHGGAGNGDAKQGSACDSVSGASIYGGGCGGYDSFSDRGSDSFECGCL
jgi:hypothetical protein